MIRVARSLRLVLVAALVMGAALVAGPGVAAAAPGNNYAIDDPFSSARTQWFRTDGSGCSSTSAPIRTSKASTRDRTAPLPGRRVDPAQLQHPMAEYETFAARVQPLGLQRQLDRPSAKERARATWSSRPSTTTATRCGPRSQHWNLRNHSSFNPNRDILAEMKAAAEPRASSSACTTRSGTGTTRTLHPTSAGTTPCSRSSRNWSTTTTRPCCGSTATGHQQSAEPVDPRRRRRAAGLRAQPRSQHRHDLQPAGKRRVVDGDFGTPEQTFPATPVDGQLWESCMTVNDHWGFANYDTTGSPRPR